MFCSGSPRSCSAELCCRPSCVKDASFKAVISFVAFFKLTIHVKAQNVSTGQHLRHLILHLLAVEARPPARRSLPVFGPLSVFLKGTLEIHGVISGHGKSASGINHELLPWSEHLSFSRDADLRPPIHVCFCRGCGPEGPSTF